MKKCIARLLCFLFLCGCTSTPKTNWESSYAEHMNSLKEENFQFGLYDMDQDEIPELLIEQEEKCMVFNSAVAMQPQRYKFLTEFAIYLAVRYITS